MKYLKFIFTLFFAISFAQEQSDESDVKNQFIKHADILWASPRGFDLTMDIYTPLKDEEKDNYPVIIMFHGGGWLINRKEIMSQSAEYLVNHGDYVVCNVNYRLLGDLGNSVKMNEIVEDAFGAVLWIKENIEQYKGNPDQLIATGDSAGGHLATMVTFYGDQLSAESDFFCNSGGFKPSYIPEKGLNEFLGDKRLKMQSAMISYGAFDVLSFALYGGMEKPSNIFWQLGNASARGIFGDTINPVDHSEFYKRVSPVYHIPDASETELPPMLFTVGEKDDLTTPESIKSFISLLKDKGHSNIEYWEHKGRPHAFLDSGENLFLGIKFEKDAPAALDRMLEFLNNIFYN
ncbi:MAG: lipase [Aquimarina sp.]|nr:lipase [Aquimarina sp.]